MRRAARNSSIRASTRHGRPVRNVSSGQCRCTMSMRSGGEAQVGQVAHEASVAGHRRVEPGVVRVGVGGAERRLRLDDERAFGARHAAASASAASARRPRHPARRSGGSRQRPRADHPGGHAPGDALRRKVLRDHRPGRHDGALADGHAGEHHDVRAEPGAVADDDVALVLRLVHDRDVALHDAVVRRGDGDVRGEQALLADDDAARAVARPDHGVLAEVRARADADALGVAERHVRRHRDALAELQPAHLAHVRVAREVRQPERVQVGAEVEQRPGRSGEPGHPAHPATPTGTANDSAIDAMTRSMSVVARVVTQIVSRVP